MKEEYIKIRNSKQYDVTWFYKYFMENGGRNTDINQFAQAIHFFHDAMQYLHIRLFGRSVYITLMRNKSYDLLPYLQ